MRSPWPPPSSVFCHAVEVAMFRMFGLALQRSIAAVIAVAIPACWATLVARQPEVPLTLDRLSLKGVVADIARAPGRRAVRLLESDNSRNTLGLAIVKDVTLSNGTIELDVAGRRGPYATPEDRGFIGIAFRVAPSADRFEYIYLRPDNGRAADQVRRNHSTQYASHPDFPCSRMRKEFPGEVRIVRRPRIGVWTHMRIDIEGTTARLFVHDAPQPALVVTDLKLGEGDGGVALWIGSGTEGFFSNLRVD